MDKICFCDSNLNFLVCCEPIVLGFKNPSSAIACMRSRYSAYVIGNIDYLIKSTYPSQRKYYSKKELETWSSENEWLKLEILFHSKDIVEFKAHFFDSNKILTIHHEKSLFKFENENWYFYSGEVF